jgi:molecular chaperone DnaJ
MVTIWSSARIKSSVCSLWSVVSNHLPKPNNNHRPQTIDHTEPLTKNHYKVLNVSPSASVDEIRKAFRKMALLYHPDKNKASSAQANFREIREAYETLKDPVKRADYNYRLYASGARQSAKPPAQNPSEILQAAARLADKVSYIDPFRVNLDTLSVEIRDILSDHNLSVLMQSNDPAVNLHITRRLLEALKLLPFPIAADGMIPLQRLAENNPMLQKELRAFITNARWQYAWNRYKIYIALLAAVVFVLILGQA